MDEKKIWWRRRRKRREKEGRRGVLKSKGKVSKWKKKKKSSPQCLVWFRLNGFSSSQNGQNNLIHNWCIGGCWVTASKQPGMRVLMV
jgi:hypothetical protein